MPSRTGVEQGVGVVDKAEEDGIRASSVRANRRAWAAWAIICSFTRGDYDGPFLSRTESTQHSSSGVYVRQPR